MAGAPVARERKLKALASIERSMTVGGLNFNCPRCNNPLFFTFKLADAGDSLKRTVACPGCQTNWAVGLDIHPR
jgi:transcription elongation factor Elf1